MYGPRIDGIQGSEQQDRGKAKASPQIASSRNKASVVHQDDPQDVAMKRGANADSKRGAIAHKVTISVATDTLFEPSDPQHQPGSMTVHHQSPSPKQGLINDPQDVGQEREEQVDPQPTPAPNLKTGASIQDIDGDNAETQVQIRIPEIPVDWQPKPPTLSYITRELSNDVGMSSMGLVVWRPSNPPVFDDNGLLVEEGRPSQQASQQGDLKEGTTEGDGKIPALAPIGEGNAENDDGMPRLT